ncbi:MAG: thiamine pyrophosphate-dependent enzyme [Candidatus Nanohaloarchaeota archaeon QJJ-9]|nr:thiamine pyrophosphate-dependent enzyme [Candidatus Nanohaloarchaeota archaeon QJJ-9]
MDLEDLETGAGKTWCPGCHNFMVLQAVKNAIVEHSEENDLEWEKYSMATGIGCHGKMFDYLDIGGVYSLHGRVIPTLTGMKIGNPNLVPIGFGGDGDTYSEGISHLVHAARFNPDAAMVVHNNRAFALTTGQATPTTGKGSVTKAQPQGHFEEAINPIELAISNDTSFVARAYPRNISQTTEILREAMEWDGFALVDLISPCLAYNIDVMDLEDRMYYMENHNPRDKQKAFSKAVEWEKGDKLPLGIFYRKSKDTMVERRPQLEELAEDDKAWFMK